MESETEREYPISLEIDNAFKTELDKSQFRRWTFKKEGQWKNELSSIKLEFTFGNWYKDIVDGFVITALLTSKPEQFVKRGKTIWKK